MTWQLWSVIQYEKTVQFNTIVFFVINISEIDIYDTHMKNSAWIRKCFVIFSWWLRIEEMHYLLYMVTLLLGNHQRTRSKKIVPDLVSDYWSIYISICKNYACAWILSSVGSLNLRYSVGIEKFVFSLYSDSFRPEISKHETQRSLVMWQNAVCFFI